MDGRTGSPWRIKIPPAGLSYFHTQVPSEDRHREENAWPILSAEPCRATGHLSSRWARPAAGNRLLAISRGPPGGALPSVNMTDVVFGSMWDRIYEVDNAQGGAIQQPIDISGITRLSPHSITSAQATMLSFRPPGFAQHRSHFC